jgi:superfamily II DNA or RNA helicase
MALATMAIESGMIAGEPAKIVVYCPKTTSEDKWAKEARIVLRDIKDLKVITVGAKDYVWHKVPKHGERAFFSDNGSRDPYRHKRYKRPSPIDDANEFIEHNGPAILVLPYEAGKLGPPWEHAYVKRTRMESKSKKTWNPYEHDYNVETWQEEVVELFCPMCGALLKDEENGAWTEGGMFAKRGSKRKQQICPSCGEPLWQCVPFSYGGRWPVAEYLNKRYSGKFYLIIDELHNAKGGDTDIGQAAQDMISATVKFLMLTATMYNGYASGIYFTLYRLSRMFRSRYEFGDRSDFVKAHGLQRTIERTETNRTSSYGYRRRGDTKRYRSEAPGVTPGIVTIGLSQMTHIQKEHVADGLPDKVVQRVPIELGPLRKIENELRSLHDMAKRAYAESGGGDSGPLARARPAELGHLDFLEPDVISVIVQKDERTGEEKVITEKHLPGFDGEAPKEIAVVNLIQEQLGEGRGVMVFFEQVNRRSAIPRVAKMLDDNGVQFFVLERDTVAPDERTVWIRRQAKRLRRMGQEPVLLTNGNLVAEGVDLLDFPTTVEYGQQFDIVKLQQRLGRAHRLGQTKRVEIYFLYYKGTAQENALALIASKLRAAQQYAGRAPEGLSTFRMKSQLVLDMLDKATKLDEGEFEHLMKSRVVNDKQVISSLSSEMIEKPEEVDVSGNGENGNGNGKKQYADPAEFLVETTSQQPSLFGV